MNRRDFLSATGAMLGTGAIAGVVSFPLISALPPTTEPALSNWDDVRSQFNLSPNKINMSCYWHASHPKSVREAIEQHRRGLDECPSEYFEENAPRLEAAVRTAAAEYLDGKPDDFAMTGSTTQGLAMIYSGLKLRPGQEILSTEQDHMMTKFSLRLRSERMGTPVRTISLYDRSDDVTEEGLVDAVIRSLTSQTRVVAITWVQSATGVKMPVGRIAQELAHINLSRSEEDQVFLCVDGLHGFGVEDFTVSDLGCDFFIAGKGRGIVASVTPPYKYEYARVTPSLWNTPAEVDTTLRTIHSLS